MGWAATLRVCPLRTGRNSGDVSPNRPTFADTKGMSQLLRVAPWRSSAVGAGGDSLDTVRPVERLLTPAPGHGSVVPERRLEDTPGTGHFAAHPRGKVAVVHGRPLPTARLVPKSCGGSPS